MLSLTIDYSSKSFPLLIGILTLKSSKPQVDKRDQIYRNHNWICSLTRYWLDILIWIPIVKFDGKNKKMLFCLVCLKLLSMTKDDDFAFLLQRDTLSTIEVRRGSFSLEHARNMECAWSKETMNATISILIIFSSTIRRRFIALSICIRASHREMTLNPQKKTALKQTHFHVHEKFMKNDKKMFFFLQSCRHCPFYSQIIVFTTEHRRMKKKRSCSVGKREVSSSWKRLFSGKRKQEMCFNIVSTKKSQAEESFNGWAIEREVEFLKCLSRR